MRTKISGFTLLELLLVLIITAIIATLGLAWYRQQVITTKITQTAEQMQQIVQAATSYYIDNTCWPNANNCPSGAPNFLAYLPIDKSLANPWGGNYSFSPVSQGGYYGKKFQVLSGKLPSQIIIDRVVTTLPSAGIASDPSQVVTEISIPLGQKYQPVPGAYDMAYIGGSGILQNGQTNSFSFSCPNGWTMGQLSVPFYLDTHDWKHNPLYPCGSGYGSSVISLLYGFPWQCTSQQSQGETTYTCTMRAIAWSWRNDQSSGCSWTRVGTGDTSFINFGYCYDPNAGKQNKKLYLY